MWLGERGEKRNPCPTPTVDLNHCQLCCMLYPVKGFLEISEDVVQNSLMLEVLFTQDSMVEYLFCGASSGFESGLFFSNYLFELGFKSIPDDFQHDFA